MDGINSTLKELERRGYLTRHQTRRENGRMGETEYVIYEQPRADVPDPETSCSDHPYREEPCTENPDTEKPDTEESCTETPAQINKDKTNKERINTEMNKERERKRAGRLRWGRYQNVLLSEQEMEELMREFPKDYQERIDRLSEYMASTGKIYQNHLATMHSWAKRDQDKRTAKPYDHKNYQFSDGESL